MHLYHTREGILLVQADASFLLEQSWDQTVNRDDLYGYLAGIAAGKASLPEADRDRLLRDGLLAPIGSQEVWAAGVTYLKSRDARIEESAASGGADCYQKVYEAERPELFFKALPHRVAGPGQPIHIRRDSTWNVPEPELTLYINDRGSIQGYTIGNDVSSRSIEGENPLYLPQAKVYERSAALGPCLFVPEQPVSPETGIHMQIWRDGALMFDESTSVSRLKRTLPELAGYLYRECDFPTGCYLMTGTCLVPGNDFTLREGDVVHISIDGIGMLMNTVAIKKGVIS